MTTRLPIHGIDATGTPDGTKSLHGDGVWRSAGVGDHLANTTDAHDASAVSYAGSAGLSSTSVEAALDELDAEKAPLTRTINAQTGTAYTLALSDAGGVVTLSNAAAVTLTVPLNSAVAFPVGTTIDLAQLGVGQVTIAGTGGVTVNADPGLKIAARYGVAALLKLGTDTWLAMGRLAV